MLVAEESRPSGRKLAPEMTRDSTHRCVCVCDSVSAAEPVRCIYTHTHAVGAGLRSIIPPLTLRVVVIPSAATVRANQIHWRKKLQYIFQWGANKHINVLYLVLHYRAIQGEVKEGRCLCLDRDLQVLHSQTEILRRLSSSSILLSSDRKCFQHTVSVLCSKSAFSI